jgi:RNA polymerase sigma-70 factor (ECF subfamily)
LGNPITDKEARTIYARFLAGDDDAFTELVETHQFALIKFIESLVGNYESAEDLAIDVFTALLVDRKPLHANTMFRTFLFAIGKNLAFKHLRQAKKHLYEPLNEYIEESVGNLDFDEAELEAQREQVGRSLGKLKADHRCVLYLLFFADMSYADAGVVMRKSEGQIRGLTYRAKQSLKQIMISEGFTYADNR